MIFIFQLYLATLNSLVSLQVCISNSISLSLNCHRDFNSTQTVFTAIKIALTAIRIVSRTIKISLTATEIAFSAVKFISSCKCHRYGRYICVKILEGWGKKCRRQHSFIKWGNFGVNSTNFYEVLSLNQLCLIEVSAFSPHKKPFFSISFG